ncbi:DUF6961 family protein [Erythrobacter aureus]|uniref:DUF6961 family protein n=1 Tax=Erythrobacter aureus TaxID=2182384 RepID=UPI003A933C94
MTLTRDQEVWGMALWVEKHHGDSGRDFIDAKIEQLTRANEPDGVKLWQQVARRLEQLSDRTQRS